MGVADWLTTKFRAESPENPATSLATVLANMEEDSLGPAASGVRVTAKRALQHAGVYACIRVLSETIASLPVHVYKMEGRGRVKDYEDWREYLLNEVPNPEGSAMELWEHVVGSANLSGRGYVYIDMLSASGAAVDGREYNLWPLPPNQVERTKTPTGALAYKVRDPDGAEQLVDPMYMIDVPSFHYGLPVIEAARQSIGSALAGDDYAGRLWANDARPGGVITMESSMTDEQFQQFRNRWEAGHRGMSRSHLVGILTGGAQWSDVGLTPESTQFLETRRFSVNEMARWFRVPPYLVADNQPGSISYASVEQQAIDFVVHSLRPWIVRIEQELCRKLFWSDEDRAAHRYPRFLVDGLLRGDTGSRFRAYAIGIQWGWLSRADVRELEDMPEVPGLEEYLVPMNMTEMGAQQMALLDLPGRNGHEQAEVT